MSKNTGGSRFIVAAGLLGVLVVGAVSCGGDDDADGSVPAATNTPSGGGSETPAAQEPVVTVSDNAFSPGRLTVAAGTTVTWNWAGNNAHSVVVESLGVQSETLTGSGTFAHVFEAAGTYAYECGIHGASMAGTIAVD